ncbi:hypothetical protein L7F22_056489 [Adiantum nelumboides]|nr:hypothetical protein [Adiantum nelumboides]
MVAFLQHCSRNLENQLSEGIASVVRDHPAYIGVCSNSSGTTPKELFEDVAEEMEKQYLENKSRIKDIIKDSKIVVTSEWTFDKFLAVFTEGSDVAGIPEPNLKFVFDDFLERAKEREEKEARKKRRAAEDFSELLRADKTISVLSTWDECKWALEASSHFRAVEDESLCIKMFDDHLAHLQEKAREKERKREEEKALEIHWASKLLKFYLQKFIALCRSEIQWAELFAEGDSIVNKKRGTSAAAHLQPVMVDCLLRWPISAQDACWWVASTGGEPNWAGASDLAGQQAAREMLPVVAQLLHEEAQVLSRGFSRWRKCWDAGW